MKRTAMIVAVAGMATALQAAPIESVTFTSVNNSGRQGGTTNEVRTATFTSSSVVKNLTITGTLSPAAGVTNTWSSQAMILVTPPGGAPSFIIQPFTGRTAMTGAETVPAGSFTMPIDLTTAANAGTWEFRFFESSWETLAATGNDSVWDTITITLDDAEPSLLPLPAFVSSDIQFEFTNKNSNVQWNGPVDSHDFVTFTPTQSTVVDTVVISGLSTGTSIANAANVFNINVGNAQYNITPVYSQLIRVLPPGGLRTNRYIVNALGAASSSRLEWFPVGIGAIDTALSPGGVPNPPIPANSGEWKVEFLSNLSSPTTPIYTSMWNKVRINLVSAPQPTATTATLVSGSNVDVSGTFDAAGEIKWIKFTIPAGTTIVGTNNNALDIGMVGTNLSPQNDAAFGLYSATGALLATSFNTGPGLLPQLSFGAGIRNAVGDGVPFDGANPGRSPSAAGGNLRATLNAGDYFLAVTNGDDDTLFRAGLFSLVPTSENNTGPYTVNFRAYLPVGSAPFDVPVSTDLGTIGATTTQTANITATTAFAWYKFTIPADATEAAGNYVDIDTANSAAPMNDTNIALYDSTGALRSFNDDIAAGWGAENPTGGNSAMSFGQGSTTRDYSSINANLPAGDGRDGELTAGTYYLQVSMCCAAYQNNRFWVINDYVTSVDTGPISVAIRTNFPPVGSACGPADIGGTGGSAGFDNVLDNNDFIVFIDNFFNQLPSADVGGTGGAPGADGLFDNNDFIVFIDQFFNGTC